MLSFSGFLTEIELLRVRSKVMFELCPWAYKNDGRNYGDLRVQAPRNELITFEKP